MIVLSFNYIMYDSFAFKIYEKWNLIPLNYLILYFYVSTRNLEEFLQVLLRFEQFVKKSFVKGEETEAHFHNLGLVNVDKIEVWVTDDFLCYSPIEISK